ncbi:cytochrome P450 6k1-like isoform X1 [Rhynchophorus ferrugineus]|uniref:cytochrome P450 6k1-like isoform X1 n=2 Tax=Rhynchophorus ferrugineus TaxID=354439 RepID=UPI003FCC2EC2
MGALYSLFLVTVLLGLLCRYFIKKFSYWKNRNVPYVKPTSIFGNLYPVLALKKTIGHWLQEQYNECNSDYFGIYAFTQPMLVIKSPTMIKDIIVKDFSYFDNRTVVINQNDEIMANLLFTKSNPSWKRIRSKMTPVFSSGKLKLMFPLVLDEAQHLVDLLKQHHCSHPTEMKEIACKYTINVIAKCAFAVNARTFENEHSEFRELGRKLFDPRLENRLRFFVARFFPGLMKFFDIYLVNPKISRTLQDIVTCVLHTRKENTNAKEKDLIDILIDLKKSDKSEDKFSEIELIAAAVNFFVAGFETVASTLAFILYELCLAPDIQERLREEIISTVQGNDGNLTYDSLSDMKYLDLIILEGMRKYPVLPFIDRRCNSDYKVPGTDLTIEKGTAIYIPLFGLHYDPKYFPNPEKFDPERFRNKTDLNCDGMYYIPFGAGPRNCIGGRFALMNMKIAISKILLNFECVRVAETPVPLVYETKSLVVASKVGLPLKLVPLEKLLF